MTTGYGYCKCGCGMKTTIAPHSRAKAGWVKGQPISYITGHNVTGQQNQRWNGGKTIGVNGRVSILMPGHPRANRYGYVREPILIVEKVFGKPLPPGAEVHHIDGNPNNNINSNLLICPNRAYHALIHQRQRAFIACGHPSWRKCRHCKQYDDPINLVISGYTVYHKECNRLANQKLKEGK